MVLKQKVFERHINYNKISAACDDRESRAVSEITEQERDLKIVETG